MARFAQYTCDPFGISVFFIQGWEHPRMMNFPELIRSQSPSGETRFAMGDPPEAERVS
jgi:hypothetical protein